METSGQAGTGVEDAGAAATAGSALTGAAGSANATCNAVCAFAGCAAPPKCLTRAYGYSDGDAIRLCIPAKTIGGAMFCSSTTCNNAPGCPMTAQIETMDWTLSAVADERTTDVQLAATVVNISGTITAVGALTCTLNATVPSEGLAMTASGVAAPAVANPALIGLNFDLLDAPLSGLGATSTNSACVTVANAYIGQTLPTMRQALLDGINAKAAQLVCLDCDGSCPQNLACSAPERRQ